MSRSVVLSLDQGNLREGFANVTVHLEEADNLYRMKLIASLPEAPEIPIIYQKLQLLSSAFYQRLCWRIRSDIEDYFEIEEASITNFSEIEFTELCQVFSERINVWLGSTKFRKIEQQLRTQLKPSEEIRFIIETDDNLLRRLPWHLWEFFNDFPKAEIALSSVEYQKPNILPVNNLRNQVKILAILGNSKGIDISQDRAFLEKLLNKAKIKFLVEPNTSQLNEELWQEGWDILFFAGHSCSKEKGLLQINQTDTIDLEQLRYALKQAISRGLKLAIFNSCDGLKLAQHLQDLYIPQVIVMREPVPDFVAQQFLKYFLDEFSSGKSLYAAVRSARERLHGLEKEYPCASWLPVIFQNPAEPPMIWPQIPIKWEDKTGSSATVFTVGAKSVQTQMRLTPATQVIAKTVTLDSLFAALNQKLLETQNRPLDSTELLILRGIWQHKTYSQIAQEGAYSLSYLTKVLAPNLYQLLSKPIGKCVTKKNCRTLLTSYALLQDSQKIIPLKQNFIDFSPNPNQDTLPRFPNGAVPLDSAFYIKQSAVQTQICEEIGKSGALIRIKAPRERGKSSMLLRILDYAERQKYRIISLNLEQVDDAILSDLNRFLRWLCVSVSNQLQLEVKLDDYWDEDIGSKVSCTSYLRYVLEQIDSPVVLALDEVNQILEHPLVAKEIFSLLRSWYEEAKKLPIWQKLRQIVVHSTEIYVPLQLHQSPFNVGLPIQLTDFSLDQVEQLAQLYQLDWKNGLQARQLMEMVEGHPGLVHLALYHLSRAELNLATLLETAPTSSGIYHHHLQRHWVTLQQEPELAVALHMVINATELVPLEPIIAYKLKSMGLIKLHNNQATMSCQLYRQYFSQSLSLA
ncbi:MAG: AAA-like domain-containing protein [Rhizonema sp. PD37]|nr:AAA-like domain-containing protein [Rhizonema sp. PD37]